MSASCSETTSRMPGQMSPITVQPHQRRREVCISVYNVDRAQPGHLSSHESSGRVKKLKIGRIRRCGD